MDMPDLAEYATRLFSDEEAMRQAARCDLHSWPLDTLLSLLAHHWPEGYDLPLPQPAMCWERLRRRWCPPEEPPSISAVLDVMVMLHAEVTTDARAVGLALSVLARTENRRN